MKKTVTLKRLFAASFLTLSIGLQAQTDADTSTFKPSGKVYGYAFGDWAYKSHADSLGAARGGKTQYAQNASSTDWNKNFNSMNIRRIYLGYDYQISRKFETQLTLAHESGQEANAGDPSLLSDNKRGLYLKYANLKWKGIFPGSNLVIGQQVTPTFATLAEVVWGYRSVEKTITDMRGISSSTDMGVSLVGTFDKNENFGYHFMVGNSNGSKLENNVYKKFYTELHAKFLDKRVIVQVNYDYDRTALTPVHKAATTMKAFVAYDSKPLTFGVEVYMQGRQNDVVHTDASVATKKDTVDASGMGVSVFVKGKIIEKLGFYARYDMFNPDTKYNNTLSYVSGGQPVVENFGTAGLDYMPHKNVHIMPNVWYNSYTSSTQGVVGHVKSDYDLVARVTFWYIFK